MTKDDPRGGTPPWMKILQLAVLGTAGCVAFSLILNYLLLLGESLTPFRRSALTAAILPIIIGAPLFIFLGVKLEQNKRYRQQLTRAANYDRVTTLLNGTVFEAAVDRRISSEPSEGARKGAFLIVDTEGIRIINMRYGLIWGEEALRIVASTIRASIRSDDISGRISANEIGIFLPNATEEHAREVGQRIKREVYRTYLAPGVLTAGGESDLINLRVAGVIVEGQIGFHAMFCAAERQLSKSVNSNEVEISQIVQLPDKKLTSDSDQTPR